MANQNKLQKYILPLLVVLALALEAAAVLPPWLAARRVAPAASVSGPMTETPTLALPAGRYLLTATYAADAVDDATLVLADAAEANTAAWQPLPLHKSSSGVAAGWLTLAAPAEVRFAVARAGDATAESADPATAPVRLNGLEISAAPALRQTACNRLAGFALADGLLLGGWLLWRRRKRADFGKTLAVVAVLGITVVAATLPLLGGHAWHGSDLGYHLRRIENIATGLSTGQIPVRIEPNWVNGYGYAVGVFYGDLFLYPAALLRMVGFSVTQAYIGYLAAVNLATALLAYLCFRAMAGGKTAARLPALAGAVLYTLAPYRFCNLYTRAALGEYTALVFLPVVALGIERVYRDPARHALADTPQAAPTGKSHRLPGWLLLAFGMSGVLYSHLLSLEMTALVLVILALCLLPKTFSRPVFGRLVAAVGAFLALGAGFLVPFFDYYLTGKFEINQPGGTEAIGQNGALLAQLFGLPVDWDAAASAGTQQNLVQGMALTPGTGLWLAALALAVLLCLRLFGRRAAGQPGAAAKKLAADAANNPAPTILVPGAWGLVLGLALAFASTGLFPWDKLYALGGPAATLVGSLQFPWRLLGPAALLLSLAAVAALTLARPRAVRWGGAALLCGLSLAAAVTFSQSYTAGARPINFYYGTEEYNWQMSCEHYLPTEQGLLNTYDLPEGPQWGEGVSVTGCVKNGAALTVTAQNTGTAPARVRLPLLYYKGYTAKDTATAQRVAVENGTNNAATLVLPAGYNGTLRVYFAEPWYWRAAELVSLAAVVGVVGLPLLRRKKAKPTSLREETNHGNRM